MLRIACPSWIGCGACWRFAAFLCTATLHSEHSVYWQSGQKREAGDSSHHWHIGRVSSPRRMRSMRWDSSTSTYSPSERMDTWLWCWLHRRHVKPSPMPALSSLERTHGVQKLWVHPSVTGSFSTPKQMPHVMIGLPPRPAGLPARCILLQVLVLRSRAQVVAGNHSRPTTFKCDGEAGGSQQKQSHAKLFARGGSYFDETPSDLVSNLQLCPPSPHSLLAVHSISILVAQAFATGLTVCTRGEEGVGNAEQSQPTKKFCKKAHKSARKNSAVGSENDTRKHWRPKDAMYSVGEGKYAQGGM